MLRLFLCDGAVFNTVNVIPKGLFFLQFQIVELLSEILKTNALEDIQHWLTEASSNGKVNDYKV